MPAPRNTRSTTTKTNRNQRSAAQSASRARAKTQDALRKGSAVANDAALGILGRIVEAIMSSRIALIALIVLVVLIIGSVFDTVGNAGRAYGNVSIGGIDVSGLNADQIKEKAQHELAPRLGSAGVTIYANEAAMAARDTGMAEQYGDEVSVEEERQNRLAWTTDSTALQAYIDYDQLAQEALDAGRGSPLDRIALFFAQNNVEVPLNYNESIIESLAHEIDLSIGEPLVNYGVEIAGGTASVSPGSDGNMIDRAVFKEQLSAQFLSEETEERAFVAECVPTPVKVSRDRAQLAADSINKAISSGISFICGNNEWYADPLTLGTWIQTAVVDQEDGTSSLSPSFSLQLARPDILKHIQPTFADGEGNVRFEQSNGKMMVHVTSAGEFPQVGSAIEGLNIALFSSAGGRTSDNIQFVENGPARVELSTQDVPETMSLEDALSYGVVAPVSTFTTEYTTGATERNINIHLAADLINNTITSADGGVWSFNDITGECNEEKGFQAARAVAGNELIDEIGGGICQVATTVFNAVYEAGYPIVERYNHSVYFPSYPQGRDAAISWPNPDFKWSNDSESDILLMMSYTDSSVTATLYSKDRGYVVTSEEGEWIEGAPYATVYETDDTLLPGVEYIKSNGENGHSITVTRTVSDSDGNVVRSDVFSSVYEPQNLVIVRGSGSYDWGTSNLTDQSIAGGEYAAA